MEKQCYCLLDLNYSSHLLSSKIADIPQKLKYETILAPIFEYCFGTSDQEVVWEEFTEKEKASYKKGVYFAESENSLTITLKIDWIRDETFLYNQIFNLVAEKVDILSRKLGLLNNRKFILNSFTYFENIDFYPNEELRNDRDFILDIVKEKGLNLKYASDELRNDQEIVKEAVKRNGMAIEFASNEIKDDKDIVMIALESMEESYNHISERLQNDTDVVIKAISHGSNFPKKGHSRGLNVPQDKLNEIFYNDRELLLKISWINGYPTLKFANYELRNDNEFVLKAIDQTLHSFNFASDELRTDKEFVKKIVEENGFCLIYASKECQDEREIVELALKSFPSVIHFISDRLRNDTEFISNSIGKGGFEWLPDEFSNDREIILESIKIREPNFETASMELKNDREFVLQAVKNNGMVLKYVNEEFKSDREIVMEAITQNGNALEFVADQLFDDEEIIIKAAQTAENTTEYSVPSFFYKLSDRLKNRQVLMKCGVFFEYFPRKYQLDREIVMECLKTSHPDVIIQTISLAYPLIINDRAIAMRIVKRNGLLLGKLPSKYRNDREIVSFAIQQNKEAFKYVSDQLKDYKY